MWGKETAELSGTSQPGAGAEEKDMVAFVGKGVTIKGNITYSGTVRVDGRIDGEVRTDGAIIVGETAEILGTIHAGSVVSRGNITGDIVATEAVKLFKPAVLEGTIEAPILSIEEGVLFKGTCTMPDAKSHTPAIETAPRLVKRAH